MLPSVSSDNLSRRPSFRQPYLRRHAPVYIISCVVGNPSITRSKRSDVSTGCRFDRRRRWGSAAYSKVSFSSLHRYMSKQKLNLV